MAIPQQGIDGIVTRQDLANFIQQTINLPPNFQAILAFLSAYRVIGGLIEGTTGNELAGAEFTSVRTGTGLYTLTFDPVFSDVPAVVTTIAQASSANVRADGNPTATDVDIAVVGLDTPFSALDRDFCFIAVGPR